MLLKGAIPVPVQIRKSVTNAQSGTNVHEIAAGVYRISTPVPARVSPFYGRPFDVIHGDRFADALGDAGIQPEYFGNTTQFIDSTDALYPRYVRQFAALYT